jgi:hypothetical protein
VLRKNPGEELANLGGLRKKAGGLRENPGGKT